MKDLMNPVQVQRTCMKCGTMMVPLMEWVGTKKVLSSAYKNEWIWCCNHRRDHLHLTCTTCGFQWPKACVDDETNEVKEGPYR